MLGPLFCLGENNFELSRGELQKACLHRALEIVRSESHKPSVRCLNEALPSWFLCERLLWTSETGSNSSVIGDITIPFLSFKIKIQIPFLWLKLAETTNQMLPTPQVKRVVNLVNKMQRKIKWQVSMAMIHLKATCSKPNCWSCIPTYTKKRFMGLSKLSCTICPFSHPYIPYNIPCCWLDSHHITVISPLHHHLYIDGIHDFFDGFIRPALYAHLITII
jgi:hypothetical protein